MKKVIGVCNELLQLWLIVFKLVGIIDWSWGVVLAPTWITLALIVTYIVICESRKEHE